jgi:L-ascorbate metabolism protein UlaG (beta-lactamase superfamily)
MKITWYGHAAFLIEGTDGEGKPVRIIHDPFSPESGYDPIDEPADILLMSQDDDRFHSHSESVKGSPTVVIGRDLPPEGVTVRGINFRAVQVWEDIPRTKNVNGMFHYTLDGVRVAHMGDIGHPLNDEECRALANTDVLLAITGGHHTIAIPDLVQAIERIMPKVVIPMHWQTGKVRLNINDNAEFYSFYRDGRIEHRDSTSIELTPETLPRDMQIVVLKHAR